MYAPFALTSLVICAVASPPMPVPLQLAAVSSAEFSIGIRIVGPPGLQRRAAPVHPASCRDRGRNAPGGRSQVEGGCHEG